MKILQKKKGLESTGRVTTENFQDKYGEDDTDIVLPPDGKDCSDVVFGEDVGSRLEYETVLGIKNSLYKGLNRDEIIKKLKNFLEKEKK